VASFLVTGLLFSLFGHFLFTPAVQNEKEPLLSSLNFLNTQQEEHRHNTQQEEHHKRFNKAKIIYLFVMWVLHLSCYAAFTTIIFLSSPWEEYFYIGFLPSEFGFMFISCLVVWCYVKCLAQRIWRHYNR